MFNLQSNQITSSQNAVEKGLCPFADEWPSWGYSEPGYKCVSSHITFKTFLQVFLRIMCSLKLGQSPGFLVTNSSLNPSKLGTLGWPGPGYEALSQKLSPHLEIKRHDKHILWIQHPNLLNKLS